MEPWDGPAGDRLHRRPPDRRHARPQRPAARALHASPTTTMVIMASEAGVLPIPEEKIVRKWRLQPGKMLLIDLEQGRIVEDEEIKADARRGRSPTRSGSTQTQFKLEELDAIEPDAPRSARRTIRRPCSIASRRSATPRRTSSSSSSRWRAQADDPIGSMGTDTPIAVLSDRPQAALQLFQAELRPGHQPADRSDPRGAGDVAGLDDRAAARTCSATTPARTSGSKSRSRS